MAALRQGRKILLLTERTDHLLGLADKLTGCGALFVLHGRLSKKQRQQTLTRLQQLPENTPHILLATGRLSGEGFDHPPLDTLMLAMPVSWQGTLQQYAGRLHRYCAGKQDLRIYDYTDPHIPSLARIAEKRRKIWTDMGYRIQS